MDIKRLSMALVALVLILATAGVFVFFGSGNDEGTDVAATATQVAGNATGAAGPPAAVAPTGGEPERVDGTNLETGREKAGDATPDIQSSLDDLAGVLAAGGPTAARQFASEHGMKLEDGRVQVVVEAGDAAAATEAVTASGGVVETSHGSLIQAFVPVEQVGDLSASPAVEYVREPEKPALAALSEGVADIGAPVWHAAGDEGTGVKVAVIDLGFQGYQNLASAGELPAGVIAVSFRADGDITGGGEKHGSACAEIVHDVAPGAQIYLVNFATDVELANAIDYVIAENIDVVSASWSFFGNFRGDGQGPVDDMVQTAHNAGVFWANVAGNASQDHWSGAFSDGNGDSWHEFAPGDDGNDINAAAGATISVYLTWNKWPVTDQDYDVYLVYEGNPNQAVAASDSWQGGTQPPSEQIHYSVPPGRGGRYWVAIKNYSASGDAVFKLYTYPLSLQYQTPAGSLAGQPTDSPFVMTAGAVPVGSTVLESFSSRGPTVDGRIKPDIVGPDRITTSSYGATGFWGTSAVAPHVAGAGALVLQAHPGYSPDQVQSFLEAQATDLGASGKDNLYGSGKLNMGQVPDLDPPVVSNVMPSGLYNAINATISADYSDSGSGIDTSTVSVTLDGSPLAGCTVTASSVSCPTTGLAGGDHAIGGSVADFQGNSAPIEGSFFVTCFPPSLGIGSPQASWASYEDYLNRELTISYSLCNTGASDSYNVNIVGSTSTNGVLFITSLPEVVGDLLRSGQPGDCSTLTFKYLVPNGVESFKTTTYVTAESPCGDSYPYPGPYIGPGT